MNYKERLKEYLEVDTLYQNYKKGIEEEKSNFDLFCVQHCLDIEKLLNEVAVKEEMLKIKDEAFEKLLKENKELHNKIQKAIEYIKETHIPDRGELSIFDEDLLEILKDSDVDE